MLTIRSLLILCCAAAFSSPQAEPYLVVFPEQGAAVTEPAAYREMPKTTDIVAARVYRKALRDARSRYFKSVDALLGSHIEVMRSYELLLHGALVELTEKQAQALVTQFGWIVEPDRKLPMATDAGPAFVGAPALWNDAQLPTRGEGVVVGVLDSGITPAHAAFSDPSPDGYDFPAIRSRLGLCNAGGACNDKLLGIYDFTDTGLAGIDADGHGTHVASTAVGNQRNGFLGQAGSEQLALSGVAPRAHLVAYKVCIADDPSTTDEDEEGCQVSAILAALEQALLDGIDVINYSIGGDPRDPWRQGSIAQAMLTLRAADIVAITSAGNDGPGARTISAPALAPWITAVANVSHDRRFTNQLEGRFGADAEFRVFSGQGATPALDLRSVVHASAFGFPLCASGEPELLPGCEDHTGQSNPFAPGTFNGEIVACDRGTYGRVEKGFNLRAAGAGGYVLLNRDRDGESTVADEHCLPAVHLGASQAEELRALLAQAPGEAEISGQVRMLEAEAAGILDASSSRGPTAFVPDILKPDIAAPGSNIVAADFASRDETLLSGTSMASPHVAGAAALLLSLRPELRADDVLSLLLLGAQPDGLTLPDAMTVADGFAVGSGLLDIARAARGGLSLRESRDAFRAADPGAGGDPQTLNLPALVSENCFQRCTFERTVHGLSSSSWTVALEGVTGTVAPASFALEEGASQGLSIELDVSEPALAGKLVEGAVVLSSSEEALSAARIPVRVVASAGRLPTLIRMDARDIRGFDEHAFAGLAALPDLDYQVSALVPARQEVVEVALDPSPENAFDGAASTRLSEPGTVGDVFIAGVEPRDNADFRLFAGLDLDADGLAERSEQRCAAGEPGQPRWCSFSLDGSARPWLLIQNARGAENAVAEVFFALSSATEDENLRAFGPGQVEESEAAFRVRFAWEDTRIAPGSVWLGALRLLPVRGAGSLPPIPMRLDREPVPAESSLVLDRLDTQFLAPNQSLVLRLEPNEGHGRLVYHPSVAGPVRVSIDSEAPVSLAVVDAEVTAGPDVPTVENIDNAFLELSVASEVEFSVDAGRRYHLVPVNENEVAIRLRISAVQPDLGASVSIAEGLWFAPQRPGAGLNINLSDDQLVLQFYTYREDGSPTWYLAQGPLFADGSFSAPLHYFRWNGNLALPTLAGRVSLSPVANDALIFSHEIFGVAGVERYRPLALVDACQSDPLGASGLWFQPTQPGFGYAVATTPETEAVILYHYDRFGVPRWTLGQKNDLFAADIEMAQFRGFCPTCEARSVQSQIVGLTTRDYGDGTSGEVFTAVDFVQPVRTGRWENSGAWINLINRPACRVR